MAGGIRIPFIADVGAFIRGTNDVSRSLEDVSDSLDDIARDARRAGDDAGDALSNGVEDGARDAERGVERLERQFRDSMRTAERETKDAENALERLGREGRQVGDDVRSGTKRAEAGLDEFRDEADSTAREAAASFDGSAESVGDAFQEVAANAFAGFGPAGAAAGLAAAVGIGFAISAIEGFKEKSEEAKQALAELTGQMIADGGRLSPDSILSRLEELVTDGTIEELRDEIKLLGIDSGDLARAMAGNADEVDRMIARLERYREALPEGPEGFEKAKAIDEINGRLREQREDLLAAEEAARLYNEASGHSIETYEAVADALDGFTDSADAYQTALQEKADAEKTSIESTRLTTQEYLAQLQEQVAAQSAWADNMRELARRGVDEGVLEELARMGPEGAPLVAELTSASDAELKQLETLMGQNAEDAVDSVVGEIRSGKGPARTAGGELGDALVSGFATPSQQRSMSAQAARMAGQAHAAAAAEIRRRGPLAIRLAYSNPGAPPVYRQGDRYMQ